MPLWQWTIAYKLKDRIPRYDSAWVGDRKTIVFCASCNEKNHPHYGKWDLVPSWYRSSRPSWVTIHCAPMEWHSAWKEIRLRHLWLRTIRRRSAVTLWWQLDVLDMITMGRHFVVEWGFSQGDHKGGKGGSQKSEAAGKRHVNTFVVWVDFQRKEEEFSAEAWSSSSLPW